MTEQGASALAAVQKRLALVGGDLSDVVQLRAYIAHSDANTLDAHIAEWEKIYRETFADGPAPALTTLPAEDSLKSRPSLPSKRAKTRERILCENA